MSDVEPASPDDPGPLIGSGRAADVYDLGDGRVLRRYRSAVPSIDVERRVMRFVADQGVPVPTVFELEVGHLVDRDIVMERVDGPTMLDDLGRRPWMVVAHARTLARLQRTINGIAAPPWLMSPTWRMSPSEQLDHDDGVLHLDLHPMNVIMSAGGPVVIDWANATGGPAGFDAAISYVLMATFETTELKDRVGREVVVRSFRRARGPREIDAFLEAACDHWLADANITPAERTNVAALRSRARRRNLNS